MLDADMFNQDLIKSFKYLSDEVIQSTEIEEKILSQKAKVEWLRLGDENNTYFHDILKEIINSLDFTS